MGGMPDPDNGVVLVADADANVLENVSSTLEKAGYEVITALGSKPLLDLCARRPKAIHLAILDITMPGAGPDLVQRISDSYPGIRILYTATTDESGRAAQFGPSGRVRDFLQKPFRRSQLLGRVLQVLDAPMVHTA